MEPTSHIKVKLGREKWILKVYSFPQAGRICTVAKSFGEGHKERVLNFTLIYCSKTVPMITGNQSLPEVPTSPLEVLTLQCYNNESLFTIFLFLIVLLLHLG
jgi:hypothetical protein